MYGVSKKKACLSLIVQIETKISSDLKRLFFAVSLYPISFFANAPFNVDFFVFKSVPNIGTIPVNGSSRSRSLTISIF